MPTYFAEIDKDGNVLRVIVIDAETLKSGHWGDPTNWIQTDMDGIMRKNPAIIGGTYNAKLDAFVHPKPYASWILDEKTAKWISPKLMPVSKEKMIWNEKVQDWEIDIEFTNLRNGLLQQ